MISTTDLENAIRNAIAVSHLEIIDQSNGCGENYAILVVSEVRVLDLPPTRILSLPAMRLGFRWQDYSSQTSLQ